MIVDLQRRGDPGMFITARVEAVTAIGPGQWAVRFASSPRTYRYSRARLLWLTHPESVDVNKKALYVKKKRIDNVSEVLRYSDAYHTFYHVTYKSGYYEDLEGDKVYVTRTDIDQYNGRSVWDYLCSLAAETGLLGDDGTNLLTLQYDLVDLCRDNVPLAQYLGLKILDRTHSLPRAIYYPFGCNASQKQAVERALSHQTSIIQGPPGTGKTQTILNIIANLLIAGKTVLVASNNNSAIENIAEKLQNEGLGFIFAMLGSVKNKNAFIEQQTLCPDMSQWLNVNPDTLNVSIRNYLVMVAQSLDDQVAQARIKADYAALFTEIEYNNIFSSNSGCESRLNDIPSAKLIKLLNRYQTLIENDEKPGVLFRAGWSLKLWRWLMPFLKQDPEHVKTSLCNAFYKARKDEIEKELQMISSRLKAVDIEENLKNLTTCSLKLLKYRIARRYGKSARETFAYRDLKARTEDFLKEYPVVLSTTYTAKTCVDKDYVFDYVIMDEASQIDIPTGALALSCAENAVIVGDSKQLPNVVTCEQAQIYHALQMSYGVDDKYNAATHSFFQSFLEVFNDAPVTLLREHYRCHPKIIEFCNQHFYDGQMVTMTSWEEDGDSSALEAVRTVKGNHARGHHNQREIDVIAQEVIPKLKNSGSVGIITPYRLQAEQINMRLQCSTASTVHKYQGRECDTIILSMVDNQPTQFSDDPNLLNVAISRAKKHLCIVTNGNEMPPESNIAQLLAYIAYNNYDIKDSALHSVFDLLYTQYTNERLEYEANHPGISIYLSENLIYNLLNKAIDELGLNHTGVLCHYPLSRLIDNWDLLNSEEKAFARHPNSHIDFLIYDSLTKRPLQAIEVDGWHYHKENEVQEYRDRLKDGLLSKYGLCPHRILTTDTVDLATIKALLQEAPASHISGH